MALAAFRSAILSRLLPFGILLLNTLPPLVSSLKSSQGLSVEAGSPFTFQPGLHSCYNATILRTVFHRAMQIKKFIIRRQTLALEVNVVAE